MLRGRTGLHHVGDVLTPDMLTILSSMLSALQTDKIVSFNSSEWTAQHECLEFFKGLQVSYLSLFCFVTFIG